MYYRYELKRVVFFIFFSRALLYNQAYSKKKKLYVVYMVYKFKEK